MNKVRGQGKERVVQVVNSNRKPQGTGARLQEYRHGTLVGHGGNKGGWRVSTIVSGDDRRSLRPSFIIRLTESLGGYEYYYLPTSRTTTSKSSTRL